MSHVNLALARRHGVRPVLDPDGQPRTYTRATNRAHKRGESFRLDGQPVLCLGREAGAPQKTYLFLAIRAVESEQRRIEADEATRKAYTDARASAIPADYLIRHGALAGGVVVMDGERIDEPTVGVAPTVPWAVVAHCEILGHVGLTVGRVADSQTLSVATMADGRRIYQEIASRGFGDDERSSYWLPADVWTQVVAAEIAARGITPEAAREWLTKYRGCVGTELYAYAAGERALSTGGER